MAKNIKKRQEDYAQWYLDVIKASQMADHSPVRGCMVIRPEGFAIWEAIQRDLDRRFKETGHVNAYFPLLIPQSFLAREAEHVEGFAMECAVVTHSKLEQTEGGGLRPGGELEEPYVIRPTSETVIGHMYSQWIKSYRDLPVLINQWVNVMRWEMRTRLFLRTSEFLWQEGHTAHETAEQAQEETIRMLDTYADFAEQSLAIPVVKGAKTETEKFPGAVTTYAIEAMMQDGKALQAGTSHNLGQNFAKAFDIRFLGRDQKQEHVHTTSWGVSTRLVGALIMAHSDDDGLVLPPRVAPNLVAIVPIFKKEEDKKMVKEFIQRIVLALVGEDECNAAERRLMAGDVQRFFFDPVTYQAILIDWREKRPGDKHFHWEQRGLPFRIEVGPRDVTDESFVLKRRLDRSKEVVKLAQASPEWLRQKLQAVQDEMLGRARDFLDASTHEASSYEELKQILKEKGGFVRCWFKPGREAEAKVKGETKATVRNIPFDQPGGEGKCILSGEVVNQQVIFAQAY